MLYAKTCLSVDSAIMNSANTFNDIIMMVWIVYNAKMNSAS